MWCLGNMRVKLVTQVEASMDEVIKGFNEELFGKLNPPYPKAEIKQFDGSVKGDKVVIVLNFLLFKQKWVSEIISNESRANYYEFVDKGIELPFFLSEWQHRHIIKQEGQRCYIVDDISFLSKNKVTTYILYPFLYLLFLYRKPIYASVFKAEQKNIQ